LIAGFSPEGDEVKSQDFYECIVIGAGPSGAMAALTLAKERVRVLIVEKEREIAKNVVCAEGISRESYSMFFNSLMEKCIASTLDRFEIHSPNGEELIFEKNCLGYILERKFFDRYLVEEALRKGAEILSGVSFQRAERIRGGFAVYLLMEGREEVKNCRLLIGADGPASKVGLSLGMRVKVKETDWHVCAQYYLFHPKIRGKTVEIHLGNRIAPDGYAWIFPKGEGVANVGVGVIGRDPKKYLDSFVNAKLRNAKIMGYQRGAVPTGGHLIQLVSDGVMLVGDAGRLADPVSGAGIPQALLSGKIAGRVGAEALRKGNLSSSFLSSYPKEYWSFYRKEYEFSYRLRGLLTKLQDEEFDILIGEARKLIDFSKMREVNPFKITLELLSSKKLLKILLKKGGKALYDYIRETVSRK